MLATTSRLKIHRGLAVAVLLALLTSPLAATEKIEWRADYDTARKEATEKNKPLLIDFGTEDCLHCRRMHQTTFRDPAIIRIINESFVPLKVDANREPKLAQALRIQAYPTMILAGNDGKIVKWIEGYMEVARLTGELQVASSIQTPDWMARDFQEAVKCEKTNDYPGAISRLKRITADRKELPVQNKAREVLQGIEEQAAGCLARAKQKEQDGQPLEALDLLADLMSRYAGSQAAVDGSKMFTLLADKPDARKKYRVDISNNLLRHATEDLNAGRYLQALDKGELLSAAYRDLPAGKEGDRIVKEIKNNPERMVVVAEAMTDRLAEIWSSLAQSHFKKGQNELAIGYYEKVVKLNPSSAAAASAQTYLTEIRGKGMSTNFPRN
jgi:tetratricopeptide (TPR) repeat protein